MTNYMSSFPPALKEIFSKLSSGYHICREDGDIYQSLAESPMYYRELFDTLGFRLSDGADGLFYFLPSDERINENSKRYIAFIAVMYDWLADQGREPVSSLAEEHFHLDELPHRASEQYIRIMDQLGVMDDKDLFRIVSGLQKLGFLALVDGTLIKFRKPITRFVNIFIEVADQDSKRKAEGLINE